MESPSQTNIEPEEIKDKDSLYLGRRLPAGYYTATFQHKPKTQSLR